MTPSLNRPPLPQLPPALAALVASPDETLRFFAAVERHPQDAAVTLAIVAFTGRKP